MANQELVIEDDNFKAILAYENKTAYTMTAKVLEKPELSAWMILLPIVFILFMQRQKKYKESSTAFMEGYLYTKKIALVTAYRLYNHDIASDEVLVIVTDAVKKNPKAEEIVLNIYNQQIEEIILLCDHYLALLTTREANYDQMLVSHYQTRDNYLGFVTRLAEVEKQVTRASTATFIDAALEVPEIMEKMEKHLGELRLEEANRFFTQG